MSQYRELSANSYPTPKVRSKQPFLADNSLKGLQDDSRHLLALFLALNLYALLALSIGYYSLAIATALPTLLLPYTWSYESCFPTILGIPFDYILPYQGHTYPYAGWSAQHRRTINGPARHGYANCFYTIPLYLALWYALIAIIYTERVTFFVLTAVLLVSRPEYWLSERFCLERAPSIFVHTLLLFRWRFIVGAFTSLLWTVAKAYMRAEVEIGTAHPSQLLILEQGPSLALACVLVIKVINTWKGVRGLWSGLLFEPYDDYWEDSATDEEIAIWEQFHHGVHGQRKRRHWERWGGSYGPQERPRTQIADDYAPGDIYGEGYSEPEALYRGSETDEDNVDADNGPGDNTTASRPNKPLQRAESAIAAGGSIPGHPLPARVAPYGFRPVGAQPPLARPPAPRHSNGSPFARAQNVSRMDRLQSVSDREPDQHRITRRIKEVIHRNPALFEKPIKRQFHALSAGAEARRRSRLEKRFVSKIQDRIAFQHVQKARRPENSIAFTVPYNDNPDPTAPQYVSIIEDPLARDPDLNYDSDGSDAAALTDIYEADDDYPDNTFPRRTWRESLIDIFGTLDVFFDRTQRSAYNLLLLIVQGAAAAVLLRVVLIGSGILPLEPQYTGTIGVLSSTLSIISAAIGYSLGGYRRWLAYWGRLVRGPVEFAANDWLFNVFLLLAFTTYWVLREWLSED